ncbi:MAG TPA: PDZ domain-containing protein, partial [Puia sp.]
GPVKDLTQTSGIAERHPAWSPDGKAIAYWSDRSGEYELTVQDNSSGHAVEKRLTSYGPGFRYAIFWSPDSKKLAFIDKANEIHIYDRNTGQTIVAGKGLRMAEGSLEAFSPSWSPDSRWLAYDRDMLNGHQAIFLYDYANKTLHPVTNGYYSCSNPVFDREGKYLFLLTNQSFNPLYSDLDNTFIYPNSTRLAAIALKRSTPSPLYPKDDTVSIRQSDKAADSNRTSADKKDKSPAAKKDEKEAEPKPVDIDIDGLESRLVFLPVDPGNYSNLQSAPGKLIFHQQPNTGDPSKEQPLQFFDFDKRKTKTILGDVSSYQLSADGKHLLVKKDGSFYIVAVDDNQKLEKKLRTSEMQMQVDPRQEWRQIFVDAWRLERDFFYDANMHGVNWDLVKERYQKMLEGAVTREDVDFIIGEMIGELSSSHTYHGGGAVEQTRHASVGYLGVDWQAEAGHYRIKKIIRPASWDAEMRSPLDMPGVSVKEGDYILAVDGVELTTATEPYAAFRNLAGHSVELTY